MKRTKLRSLIDEVNWQNQNGTAESFRNALCRLGSWVFHLWATERINPDEIKATGATYLLDKLAEAEAEKGNLAKEVARLARESVQRELALARLEAAIIAAGIAED